MPLFPLPAGEALTRGEGPHKTWHLQYTHSLCWLHPVYRGPDGIAPHRFSPSPPQDAVCQESGRPAHQTAWRRADQQHQEAVHETGHTDNLPAPQRRQ